MFEPTVPPAPESSPGRRIALVVGVDGQPAPGRAALKYAVDDAREMAAVLHDSCGFKLFHSLLLGEQATSENLRKAVIALAREIKDGDMVLFYFSGHGEAITGQADIEDIYFVTHDFDSDDLDFDAQAHLSMRWLHEILYEHKKAVDVLVILECCYAGNMGGTSHDLYLDELLQRLRYYFDSPPAMSEASRKGLRLTLSATAPNVVAHERDGHGVMTAVLLPALQGQRLKAFDPNKPDSITFGSLYNYLENQMPKEQQPWFFGAGKSLVLATYAGRIEQLQHEQRQVERSHKLRAMFADHSVFLGDRLANFQGRARELTELRQKIAERQQTGGYVTVTGRAGQGKSSMIAQLVVDYAIEQQQGQDGVAFHFIPLNPGRDHQFGLLRNLMAHLILKYNLPDFYVDGQSTAALRDYFPRVLKDIAAQGGQEIIFIDGLDQLEEEGLGEGTQGKRDLSFLPNHVPQGIVFVLGTRPNDTLRPLELLKPHDEYQLSNLSRGDFDLILQHHSVAMNPHIAGQLYRVLDENALFLDLAAKELAERGSISAVYVKAIIKEIAENPENLFGLAVDRLSQRETLWKQVIKPILGMLLVAREPLSRVQLKHIINLNQTQPVDSWHINEGLERLGGLVISDGQQRYTLFHLKLREYLSEDVSRPHKRFVFDAEEDQLLHQWFVTWCEQGRLADIWDDVQNAAKQERRIYARQHYIAHLYYAQAWQKLFTVLDEGAYGKAKVLYDLSTRIYAQDLDWGRKAAASTCWNLENGILHLPYLWRYTLLRCSLASRADQYPTGAFQLMLLLGYEARVWGLVDLITDPTRRAKTLRVTGKYLVELPGREPDGRQTFMRMYEVISTITDEELRSEALSDLGQTLVGTHQWQDAEWIINMMGNSWRKVKALSAFGVMFVEKQLWEQAKEVWKKTERMIGTIRDASEQAKAWAVLGRALAHGQQWEEAKRAWKKAEWVIGTIGGTLQREMALKVLGQTLTQAWQWEEAKRVISIIWNTYIRAMALAELGKELALAQRFQEANQVWTQVEQIISRMDRNWYREEALSYLGQALAQAQQWKQAEHAINMIIDEPKRIEALSGLGVALAQAQQWEQASQVWTQVEQMINKSEDTFWRVKVLITLGQVLAQAKRVEDAKQIWRKSEKILRTIRDDDSKISLLSMLWQAQVQAKQQRKARSSWRLAKQMIDTSVDQADQETGLTMLVVALTEAQQWKEAAYEISTALDEDFQDEAWRVVAEALIQAHQWAEAEKVISGIDNVTMQAEMLSMLGECLMQGQRYEEAERVLKKAVKMIEGQETFGVSDEILGILAALLAQTQQWKQAKRVISTIQYPAYRGIALSVLGKELAQAQQWEEANQVWAQAEQVINVENIEWRKVKALSVLGKELAQAQQWEEANQVWAQAEQVIRTIHPETELSGNKWFTRESALRTLGNTLAQMHQWVESERVIRRIEDKVNREGALGELGRALIQAEQLLEAERVIDSISDTKALRELAAALATHHEDRWLLRLVQQYWLRVERRNEAIELLPLAYHFIPHYPELGLAFSDAFTWIDEFLRG